MALRELVLPTLVFASCLLPFCVFGFEDGSHGSASVSKRCECDSVEFWLPERTNGASKLLSYEEIDSNIPNDIKILSKNDVDRGLHLWLPKHCELSSDNALILQKDAGVKSQNIAKDFVEVWTPSVNCMAATLKCKLKTLCIGIETRKEDLPQRIFYLGGMDAFWSDANLFYPTKAALGHELAFLMPKMKVILKPQVQSTQRKLLMFKTVASEETFAHQPFAVLLSVLVFCSMIILIALCGKAEKKPRETVAHDSAGDIVKMVSSEKVKSLRNTDTVNDEGEIIDIKVEGSSNLETDSNSNSAKQLVADVELSSVVVSESEAQKDDGKNSIDEAVLQDNGNNPNTGKAGVEKQKEIDSWEKTEEENDIREGKKDKRKDEKERRDKHKEIKNKDRNKDMRSKRSHTSPERVEKKSSTSKMRFSLKGSNAYEEPKVKKRDKTKSKKTAESNSPLPNSAFRGDRRSFTNRELPKRPSEERDNPPACAYGTDEEEENYECVKIQGGPPRSPVKLKSVPSQICDNDPDLDLYDSVDDTKVVKPQTGAGPDTISDDELEDAYEVVETKASKPRSTAPTSAILLTKPPAAELYESVSGDYENPGVTKQRSFSERKPGRSSPKTDAQRKAMSLGRERRQENAPTPPPLEHMHQIASHQIMIDDIEPYTVTVKKGDHILQETSISTHGWPPKHIEETNLSPEEKDQLYTKVDKEKQKKDRMENPGDAGVIGDNEVTGRAGATVSISVVSGEEHQYETMPRTKNSETALEKKDSVQEEHQYEAMPRQKDSETTPQKKESSQEEHPYAKVHVKQDSFDLTEDPELYEEVETKKDNTNPKSATVFV